MADAVWRSEGELVGSRLEQLAVPLAAIRGTPGADRLAGTGQADRIDARGGDDVVTGRGGADNLLGRSGDDLLRGGGGADRLVGGGGEDELQGGNGADRLAGGGGKDLLLGGGGADRLKGGGGDDVLDGGAGPDRLTGGAGRDSFRFQALDDGIDRITDYELGVDRLDLGRLLPEFAAGDRLADFVRLTVDDGDTIVAVSEDGSGDSFVDLARLLEVEIRALPPADLGLPTGPAGEPSLASTNGEGEVADGLAFLPSLSGDGRFVTFASTADNLVEGTSDGFNLYRKDLVSGDILLVAEGRDKSALSADGETVVHRSFGGGDIRVTEIDSGRTLLLGSIDEPSITADGSRAAFEDDSGGRVARVVDTATGASIVSIPDVGEANPVRATLGTGRPDLSPDGDWLAFSREGQILLRGVADGDDILVTAGGNGASTQPAVSSDGRFVTFQSGATNLVAEDDDVFIDVYRAEIDPAGGAVIGIELVSAAASGSSGDGDSLTPAISDDGRFIAFRSAASNLAPGDQNGIPDIFVKDMASGLVQRLELIGDSSEVIPQRLFQAAPDISGDGAFVAYTSDLALVGEDLVAGQVYVAAVGFDDPASLGPAGLPSDLVAASAPDLASLLQEAPEPAIA